MPHSNSLITSNVSKKSKHGSIIIGCSNIQKCAPAVPAKVHFKEYFNYPTIFAVMDKWSSLAGGL